MVNVPWLPNYRIVPISFQSDTTVNRLMCILSEFYMYMCINENRCKTFKHKYDYTTCRNRFYNTFFSEMYLEIFPYLYIYIGLKK